MENFSDTDSFILISVNNSDRSGSIQPNKPSKISSTTLIVSNAQLTQSIVSNKDNVSLDGWSEISAPSINNHNGMLY